MATPNRPLSVVLTVHNAEKTLASQVTRLLDLLPDLTARFELLIVDDGSTDQTEEVAHELKRDYPQLQVARHARRLGPPAVAKTAFERTTGDVVILHEGPTNVATNALRDACKSEPGAGTPDTNSDTRSAVESNAAVRTPSATRTNPVLNVPPVRGGIQFLYRRTDNGTPSGLPPQGSAGTADRPSSALPRIVALLMAQRGPETTPEAHAT